MSFRARRRRQWVGLRPQFLRNNQRLDAQTRPPLRFFDGAMHLAMMHPADRREPSLTLRPSARGWASRTDTPIGETKPIFAVA